MSSFYIKKYILRVVTINLLGIIFISDTISFDQGFFSIQGLIYSINKYLLLFFIFWETVFSYFQEYGLNFEFLYLIINQFFSLNFKYNSFIIFEKINYLFFFLLFVMYIFYLEKKIIHNAKSLINLKYITTFLIITSLISLLQINRTQFYLQKIKNIQDISIKYNILRNDNWYLKTFNYFNYEKISDQEKFQILNYDKVIDPNSNNIFVIINESYPLFKNHQLNEDMFKNLIGEKLKFQIIKKNWNKKYSTLGAEIEFFCNSDKNFKNFKANFIKHLHDNKCWILNLTNKNKVFIHTYKKSFFGRASYDDFFSKTYFLEDLEKLNFNKCPGMYEGICDYEILTSFNNFLKKDNNFIVFLTLLNHHPIQLYPVIKKEKMKDCKNLYPLNINDQFCYLYLNQSYFNKLIYEKIIKTMDKNDQLLIISDTPPAFIKKWKIFFEDYVEVIKITK